MAKPVFPKSQSTVKVIAKDIRLSLKNLLLPAFCQKCGVRILTEENLYFCADCWSTIEPLSEPKCPRCGKPHSRRVGFEPIENIECLECFGEKLWFRNTYAAGLHADILRDAIHLLKYKRKRFIAGPLGELLLQRVSREIDFASYDMIIPTPLHRNRVRQRGYNQAELIAEELCRRIPGMDSRAILRRVKDTPSFSLLGANERKAQIKNAFEVVPGARLKKKRLLLVDDVVTTGATTNECARALRRAGADRIDVIAVAVAKRLN